MVTRKRFTSKKEEKKEKKKISENDYQKIKKDKFLAITSKGYDEYYILPGGEQLTPENETLDDELVGASKAKLKSAFGKSMKGKLSSRQLLNKFVAMVA